MKSIPLNVIFLYLGIAASFAQTKAPVDSTAYKSRKLKFDEANIVSGYYNQNGNNSAVTGGIGTEKLTDFSNNIELKLSKYDSRGNQHIFNATIGIDTYTSASSDKIDPSTVSSPSYSDVRVYPSLAWNIQNDRKGTNFGIVGSFSTEYDYTSVGGGLNFAKTSKDQNTEFAVKLQAFLDQWKVILPVELRPEGYGSGSESDRRPVDYRPRNSFSAAFSLSQVINKNLQVALITEPAYQHGLLATKYQRVYFTNGAVNSETLPGSRYKLPIGARLSYFLGDRVIVRGFYRYYVDDWGIHGNTAELELPVKISPFFSISPFYRYYNQSASQYFSGYALHTISDSFFTSDYDLSKFNSNFIGAGIRLAPPGGIAGLQHISMVEIRYGHYTRSNGLASNNISLNLRFK